MGQAVVFFPVSYQVAMDSIPGWPTFLPFLGAGRRQEAIHYAFLLAGAAPEVQVTEDLTVLPGETADEKLLRLWNVNGHLYSSR